LGVKRLIASCLNDACQHTALIDVWSYPPETEVPSFRRFRPNWKEHCEFPESGFRRDGHRMNGARRQKEIARHGTNSLH
jgi:hypothetical protein